MLVLGEPSARTLGSSSFTILIPGRRGASLVVVSTVQCGVVEERRQPQNVPCPLSNKTRAMEQKSPSTALSVSGFSVRYFSSFSLSHTNTLMELFYIYALVQMHTKSYVYVQYIPYTGKVSRSKTFANS